MDYFRGDVCGVDNCRATQYYIEDGLSYCKNGHRREGRTQVQEDEDDFGTQGRKTRQKRETREKVSRIYRGPKAFELYLQAYQLILWKQCFWLVHTKGFPAELENIVHDLWALRLQLLKARTEEPSDTETASHVFSSQSEDETETAAEEARRKRKKLRGKDAPTLVDTLGMCYLATLLLRLPVSVGDLHRWAVREEILFVRAVRFVPLAMREKLPGHYLGALDTRSVLKSDHLHNSVVELVLIYNREFGMSFPALNHPLLLFKYIKELAIPLDVYPVIDRLTLLCSYDFLFPTSGTRYRVSSLPEPQLMSLLIIAVKLYYPFDAITRCPRTSTEPAALSIDWKAWAAIQDNDIARNHVGRALEKGKEMEIGEHDVFNMTERQMDEYLDWYGKTWLDEEARNSNPKALPAQLLDMFPTNRAGGSIIPQEHALSGEGESKVEQEAVLDKVKQVQSSMGMRRVISDVDAEHNKEPVKRPGSYYKHYRRVQDLPHDAKVFFEAAARAVGLSLHTLVKAVFQTECKLQAWKLARRRAEAAKLIQDDVPALSTDGSEPKTLHLHGRDHESE
ncbi:MAG: Pol I core factor CF [Pleopsidium flavum]|nr:MAG: Pol I core factor CF [Pleopsidium flavum]